MRRGYTSNVLTQINGDKRPSLTSDDFFVTDVTCQKNF